MVIKLIVGMESRWRGGRTRSSRLPTTRAPARHWWGTSTPKETGGTPERPGRMWGGVKGEEKWSPDGTGTPEGWLGEGRASHTWTDPRGLGGSGGVCLAFPLPNWAQVSLLGSWAGSSTFWGPLWPRWS